MVVVGKFWWRKIRPFCRFFLKNLGSSWAPVSISLLDLRFLFVLWCSFILTKEVLRILAQFICFHTSWRWLLTSWRWIRFYTVDNVFIYRQSDASTLPNPRIYYSLGFGLSYVCHSTLNTNWLVFDGLIREWSLKGENS